MTKANCQLPPCLKSTSIGLEVGAHPKNLELMNGTNMEHAGTILQSNRTIYKKELILRMISLNRL